MKIPRYVIGVIIVVIVVIAAAAIFLRPPGRIPVRWATSDVGSYGYSVAAIFADVLERELPEEYDISVFPHPSTTAAMKSCMALEAEVSYTADVGMRALYDATGPYAPPYTPKKKLVHTFYAYPMESFMMILAANADELQPLGWKALDGKKVFFTPSGYMNWLNWKRIFKALGYEFNHVEIDKGATAEQLEAGAILAAASYTTAGVSLPSWWRAEELEADVTVLNPTPEEIERLKAAGLTVRSVKPTVFTQPIEGVTEILGVPILFGYNVTTEQPEEFAYLMLKGLEKQKENMFKLEKGFGPLKDDFVGLQVAGVSANPDIPVHPGLAKFLKEKGVWKPEWIIAS